MKQLSLILVVASSLAFTAGCGTKNYVRNTATPIINKTNELDELTAKNSNAIRDVDTRAQQGIQGVNQKATSADQKAMAAGQVADQAQQRDTHISCKADQQQNTVAHLRNEQHMIRPDTHYLI